MGIVSSIVSKIGREKTHKSNLVERSMMVRLINESTHPITTNPGLHIMILFFIFFTDYLTSPLTTGRYTDRVTHIPIPSSIAQLKPNFNFFLLKVSN